MRKKKVESDLCGMHLISQKINNNRDRKGESSFYKREALAPIFGFMIYRNMNRCIDVKAHRSLEDSRTGL